jgi:hypothetical protein
MKIFRWTKTRYLRREKGTLVEVSPHEAYTLIQSLASQLARGNPNSGREERFTADGEYFTIAITKE